MSSSSRPLQSISEHANPAVSAEPPGIGTVDARDLLSREVKLLGALLGQVIAEQAGPDVLELVERVRRLTIDLRRLVQLTVSGVAAGLQNTG